MNLDSSAVHTTICHDSGEKLWGVNYSLLQSGFDEAKENGAGPLDSFDIK